LGGALFALAVNWFLMHVAERRRKIASGNYALMVLVQHVNDLLNTERQLAAWRTPGKRDHGWFTEKALVGFSEVPNLHIEDLGWMLATEHRNLVGEVIAARNGYRTVEGLIALRNKVKAKVDDHLESVFSAQKIRPETYISGELLMSILTPREIAELQTLFTEILDTNLNVVLTQFDLVHRLSIALKSIWPRQSFIHFDSMEAQLSRFDLVLEGGRILPKGWRREPTPVSVHFWFTISIPIADQ
jgi:hypothetical protein